LETLPNIDINIKCGNSLIARFGLDADLKKALKQSKWNIESYKIAVDTYRNAESKEQKKDMERLIADIKGNFRSEIGINDPKKLTLEKKKGELFNYTQQVGLFERSKKEQTQWNKTVNTLSAEVQKLETDIEEIKSNKIYENAFEWRFEFPEVLNNAGDFVGFDVVIGNPPYISVKDLNKSEKDFYIKRYQSITGQFDLYQTFTENSMNIMKSNGLFSMITSNTFISNRDCQIFRKFLIEKSNLIEILNLDESVFTDAKLDVCIFSYSKNTHPKNKLKLVNSINSFLNSDFSYVNISDISNDNFDLNINYLKEDLPIFIKLNNFPKLESIVNINRGIEFGGNNPDLTKFKKDDYFPLIVGGDIAKYAIKKIDKFSTFDYNNKSVYKDFDLYSSPKIFIQRIRNLSLKDRIVATFYENTILSTNTLRILTLKEDSFNLKILLGILNSKLINYFFSKRFNNKDIYGYQLAQIPIPIISNDLGLLNKVDQILTLKQSNASADTSLLEREIDLMVYELYGLSAEEIGVVEGG
jgi:hypothetical protein